MSSRQPSSGVTSQPAAPDKRPDRIAAMFDSIASRYDLLNRVLSGGLDQWWRRRAIESLRIGGRDVVLDVCTGTADVALLARAAGAMRVVGVDFAGAMLAIGARKVRQAGEVDRIVLVRGDATRIPLRDASADAATVAFGIRNVQHPELACREMARVLRPNGRLAILEFGVPRVPGISRLYLWYFKYLLPAIGRSVSGHNSAYSYLPTSVGAFPPPAEFVTILRQTGFEDVRTVPLTLGIVYLYTARRA